MDPSEAVAEQTQPQMSKNLSSAFATEMLVLSMVRLVYVLQKIVPPAPDILY